MLEYDTRFYFLSRTIIMQIFKAIDPHKLLYK